MNCQSVNNDEAGGEFENESETKAGRRAAGAVEAEIGAGNGNEEGEGEGGDSRMIAAEVLVAWHD